MLRPSLLALSLLFACGGSGKPAAVSAPATPPDPAGLLRVREAYKVFAASAGSGDDYEILSDAASVERPELPKAAQAEADLLVAVAASRLLGAYLDRLADPRDAAHDVIGATVLPEAFRERPLDGESVAAYRDRLCEGPAQARCAEVLPDFWGAALAYAAAPRLVERAGGLSAACACGTRYNTERDAMRIVAEGAAGKDAAERPGWALDKDTLGRSAFASPERAPGDVLVRAELGEGATLAKIGADELAVGKTAKDKKALEERLKGLREAAGQPGPQGAYVLVVEVKAAARAESLITLAQHAARAGFTVIDLEVRVAAPPHPRGYLRLLLVDAARAPKGVTGLKAGKKDALQAWVDKIDGALAASEGVRVAWLLR